MSHFTQKLPLIRKNLSQREDRIYLNTGVIGPLSAAAKLAAAEALFSAGEKNGYQILREIGDKTRGSIARLVHALPEEIALKNSTTHGIYEALWSLPWNQGDEVLISDVEHHAVIRPLLLLADRYGIVIRYFETREGKSLESFTAALSDKTKLAAFSHVSYITGERLPAKELTAAAHQRGVPVLIDGAQAVGAVEVDLEDLGVDYYSLPGQKWLFGPQGTAALFVRKGILEGYHPLINNAEKPYPYQDEKISTDIRRFEPAAPNGFVLAGLGASVDWLLEEVGKTEAFAAIAATVAYVREQLAALKGITLITPDNSAGLVSLKVLTKDPKALLAYLEEQRISARTVDPFGYVRLSFSYFVTPEETGRLLESLRKFLNS
ncbi:MAG: aminotransferase class V-fold PLP-dependent enzyme [Treponema sp.]|jgi:L-cysteine/cystine lyase|nr:aminotransferase class V-fold PLP-dependent enzyme [Treponema sp.]